MRILGWIVTAVLLVLACDFAASNRMAVALELWPLPARLDLPLYLVVAGALLIGIAGGLLYAWAAHLPVRRDRRAHARRAGQLEAELVKLREPAPAGDPPPALSA